MTLHLVLPALVSSLSRLDPTTREIASYHLGLTSPDSSPTPGPGKLIRPTLTLLSASAAHDLPLDALLTAALPAALAVQLLHDSSLLHDDVVDLSPTRRSRPAAWTLWGSSASLLAGDALLALSLEVLLDSDSPALPLAARLLTTTIRELVRGQQEDTAPPAPFTLEDCLSLASGKTAALLSTSAALGPLLTSAPSHATSSLASFGHHLGLAFQIHDDVLGIWADPTTTGKPTSDLACRKRSFPVAYALSVLPPSSPLHSLYASPASPADPDLTSFLDEVDARSWAEAEVSSHLSLALSPLSSLPPSPARAALSDLATSLFS